MGRVLVHLREVIYAGIAFALIAGSLWIAAMNSPEGEGARVEEAEILELDLPARKDIDKRLFDEPKTNIATDETAFEQSKLFATAATKFEDRSDEAAILLDSEVGESRASDAAGTPVETLLQQPQQTNRQLAVVADAETGALNVDGGRNVNPHFDSASVPVKRESPKQPRANAQTVADNQRSSEKNTHKFVANSAVKKQIRNGFVPSPIENTRTQYRDGKSGEVDNAPSQAKPVTSIPGTNSGAEPLVLDEPSVQQAPLVRDKPFVPTEDKPSHLASTSNAATQSVPVPEVLMADLPETAETASTVAEILLPRELIWWKDSVRKPVSGSTNHEIVGLEDLLTTALMQAPSIIAISQQPLIEQQEIVRSDADFDPELFMRTKFDNRNDPVGNTLTTGGEPFLQDKIWSGRSGIRKKMRTGASVDLAQEIGFKNSNSQFFQPQDQGTSTLSLNFSQPLLRGGGRMYNMNRVFLAQTLADASQQRYHSELQEELLKVAEAYWKLYYFRCRLVQIQNNIARGEAILTKLESRAELDSLPTQIARARAAVLSRKAQVANALRDVRNAETTIRKLVAAPNWAARYNVEMLPLEQPVYDHLDLPVDKVVETALEVRPEIKQAMQRAKSASIQLDISRNELLPELNMLLGGYVAGLEGNSGVFPAWAEQFGTTPGYYAGVEFSVPYRNRSARSTYRQRELNLRKITAEVEIAIQDIVADAQISLRQVNSAHETLATSISSIEAAHADLKFQKQRWDSFAFLEGDFADGQNPSTLLDQLLESQQRLTNEELAFSRAEFDFKLAQFYLKKAMGTLLQTAQHKSPASNILAE